LVEADEGLNAEMAEWEDATRADGLNGRNWAHGIAMSNGSLTD